MTPRTCRSLLAALFFWMLAFAVLPAHAHKASDAYLQLSRDGDRIDLRWDIALRDLDAVLDLDANADQKLSWGEVRTRLGDIQAYALGRLRLQGGQCVPADTRPPAIDNRIDGAYLVLQMQAPCSAAAALSIDYRLFQDVDPTHRGLLRAQTQSAAAPMLRSLDPSAGPVSIEWADTREASPPARFFADGIHHILIGYDHILFLICLLLPAVLQRKHGVWTPVLAWKDAAWPMLGIVTMFTIAHSITLALAGLKIVTISPHLIEPAIAITIIVAALDNIRPVLRGRRRLFSFLFGLIHGFGFAGALGEIELPTRQFVLALLQFNLGVEAGQLAVVAVALMVLLALRNWRRYPPLVLHGGSMAAVVVATVWLCERVLDVKVLPFS
ncbi:HupE/UreJ family protein [Variovorax paradoxus]|uniref:HupE/UreJ family protein n=1 Tax=Variovorax paradoxus TaxID=34073 RepID=A0A5Q0M8R0_VARPD|nr:HupE/UreJ family protein [Variovorax paradoxus]QFZ84792.1 HupE/UreJ family protein [Variovorax paradoxus]